MGRVMFCEGREELKVEEKGVENERKKEEGGESYSAVRRMIKEVNVIRGVMICIEGRKRSRKRRKIVNSAVQMIKEVNV